MVWFDFLLVFQNKYAERPKEAMDPFDNSTRISAKAINSASPSSFFEAYGKPGAVIKIEFQDKTFLTFSVVSVSQESGNFKLTVASNQDSKGNFLKEPKIQSWDIKELKIANLANPPVSFLYYSKDKVPASGGEIKLLSNLAYNHFSIEQELIQPKEEFSKLSSLSKEIKRVVALAEDKTFQMEPLLNNLSEQMKSIEKQFSEYASKNSSERANSKAQIDVEISTCKYLICTLFDETQKYKQGSTADHLSDKLDKEEISLNLAFLVMKTKAAQAYGSAVQFKNYEELDGFKFENVKLTSLEGHLNTVYDSIDESRRGLEKTLERGTTVSTSIHIFFDKINYLNELSQMAISDMISEKYGQNTSLIKSILNPINIEMARNTVADMIDILPTGKGASKVVKTANYLAKAAVAGNILYNSYKAAENGDYVLGLSLALTGTGHHLSSAANKLHFEKVAKGLEKTSRIARGALMYKGTQASVQSFVTMADKGYTTTQDVVSGFNDVASYLVPSMIPRFNKGTASGVENPNLNKSVNENTSKATDLGWRAGKNREEKQNLPTKESVSELTTVESTWASGKIEREKISSAKEQKNRSYYDPNIKRDAGSAIDFISSTKKEHREELELAMNSLSEKNISNTVFKNLVSGFDKLYKKDNEFCIKTAREISQMKGEDLSFVEKIKGKEEVVLITEHLNKIADLSLDSNIRKNTASIFSACKTSNDKATVIQNLSHIGQREGAVTALEIDGQALAIMIANKHNESVKSIRPYLEKTNESADYSLFIGNEGKVEDILKTINSIEGKMKELDIELAGPAKYSVEDFSKFITADELKSKGTNTILIGADAKNMWITNQLGMQLGDVKLNLYHKYLKEAGANLGIARKTELNAGADEGIIVITVKGDVPFEKLKSITEKVENEAKQLLSKEINELKIDDIFKKHLLDGISSESVIGKLKLEETATGQGRLNFFELSETNGKVVETISSLEHALNNSEMKHLYENIPKETRENLDSWLNYKFDDSLNGYLLPTKGKSEEIYTFVLRAEVNEDIGKSVGKVCTIAEKRGILASGMAENGSIISASELNTFAGHVSLNGIRDTFTAYCNKLASEKYSEQIKNLGYESIEFHSDGPLVYYFVGKKNGKDSRIEIEKVESLGILDEAKALTIKHFDEKSLGVTDLKLFKDSGDSNKYLLEKAIGKENVEELFSTFKTDRNVKHAKEVAYAPSNQKELDKIIFDHSMNRIETGMAITRIAIMTKDQKPELFKESMKGFNHKEVDFLAENLLKETGENNKLVRISSEVIYLIFNDKTFTKKEALSFLGKLEDVDKLKNTIGQELHIHSEALK